MAAPAAAPAQPPPQTTLNPRTTSFEFAGPLGALGVTLITPLVTYLLYFGCNPSSGCPPALGSIPARISEAVSSPDFWASLWDGKAVAAYVAWYAFCVAAWAGIPGEWVKGTAMRDGRRKEYKINAFPTLLMATGFAVGQILRAGPEGFTFIYDHWVGLVSASVAMAVAQAAYVYARSFEQGKLLALGGNSGNFIYDFFIGRELNPSIGSFDIKSFNELRPGLILWFLIDLSMACKQYVLHGALTDSMVLVVLFHTWYVFDALYNETSIFTTMDITTDGFGFMLAIGDLAWVPFTYSLQARFLAFAPVQLGVLGTAAVVALQLAGYCIFRVANKEKNDFRNGKNPKHLTFMQTQRGTKLLTSGWWGRSRHPNYFGDLIMAVAWCLPTGFSTPITYFYPVYFAVLLVHRQHRDDEQCRIKYGKDWDAYCKIVPWKIIPYVY